MKKQELHSQFTFQIEPKHYYKHNFLTYCNDVLVSILQYSDKTKLSTVQIDFKSGEDCKTFENSEDWQEWLIDNGFKTEMYEAYYRHTLFSLVSDFCHYMLESINCAAKMKVAVSYALLRKPLKDTLGYIEWLFADRIELLDLLINGKPEELIITKELAKKHTEAVEKKFGGCSYFDFRYNKSEQTSLEHIWNNASHLVTTRYKLSKTEPGNLNFVFADEKCLREYSDYYYLVVPGVMMYAMSLICSMFEEFAPLNDYTLIMNKINRLTRSYSVIESSSFEMVEKMIDETDIPVICPRCGLKKKMTAKTIFKFINGSIRCNRCFKTINTGRYIFDWEKLEINPKQENEKENSK